MKYKYQDTNKHKKTLQFYPASPSPLCMHYVFLYIYQILFQLNENRNQEQPTLPLPFHTNHYEENIHTTI